MSDEILEPELKKLKYCKKIYNTYFEKNNLQCYYEIWSDNNNIKNHDVFNQNEKIKISTMLYNSNIYCLTHFTNFKKEIEQTVNKNQKIIKKVKTTHKTESHNYVCIDETVEYNNYLVYMKHQEDKKYNLSLLKHFQITPQINIIKDETYSNILFKATKNI